MPTTSKRTSPDPIGEYTTSNLYEAAYLLTRGVQYLEAQRSGRGEQVQFRFEIEAAQLSELKREWHADASAPARTYSANLRFLRETLAQVRDL